jgi:hypothetical protein
MTKKKTAKFRNLDKAFAGFTAVCSRGAKGDYRGALQQLGAMPEVPPGAEPVREGLNDTLGAIVACKKHTYGPSVPSDSNPCLKCGWTPPPVP